MKQKLLLKTLLLLCALVAGSSSVWAADLTLDLSSSTGWTISKSGTSGTGSAVEMSKDGITITANKGYWEGSQLRVYSGSSFTVASSIGNMSKIVLTYTGGKEGPLSNYESGTATISPAAASLSSEASGQARITKIVVTYSAGAVANPTFSPAAGAVEKGTSVTISTTTDGASIYYTTDGNTPTSSSTEYSSALTINSAQTIKAIAIKGSDASSVITAAYTIKKVESPTFTVDEGQVIAGTTVELSTTTEGATIHYTTDGSTPTSSSTTYTSAISIDANMTIKAIAVKSNWDDSDIASAAYTTLAAINGYTIDFEADKVSQYVDWEFDNVGIHSSGITAHGGSKWGANVNLSGNGTNTCSIKTKNKVAYPGLLKFWISKESGNTTASSWVVEVSDNGSDWTPVGAAQDAKGMAKSAWVEVKRDLSAYTDVYVQISYGSSNAIRAIDDIVLTDGEYPVAIPASGFATLFCAGPLDFSGTSVKAYVVKDDDASDGYVTLTQVSKVPAGTGLVLEGSAGTVNIPLFDGTGATKVTGNLMLGTANATTAVTANGGYILKDGAFHPANAGNLPAGKAYLKIAVPAGAPVLNLDFGGTTGINAVNGSEFKVNGEYYNLAGQRVANPTKGLYIVNGKKVIIK